MNQLNSIIIEGTVEAGSRILSKSGESTMLLFTVMSERTYRGMDGAIHTETTSVPIESHGALADACYTRAVEGRVVRIVGRLKQEFMEVDGKKTSKLVLLAEYIEFKPLSKKN